MSGTFQRIGNTYVAPYAPQSTTHDGELPVSPHQLPISPWGVMGSCETSSVFGAVYSTMVGTTGKGSCVLHEPPTYVEYTQPSVLSPHF